MKFVKNQKQRGVDKSRRRFLDIVGRSGISSSVLKASPLVMGAMTSRFVEAAPGAGKRVVFMYFGNGSPPGNWLPQSESQMNNGTTPFGTGGPGVKGYNVAKYCNFFEVQNSFGNHGDGFNCMVPSSGHNNPNNVGNTIDTQIAKKNFFGSQQEIIRVGAHQNQGGISIENGQLSNFIDGPARAFSDLFNGVSVSGTDKTFEKVFAMNAQAVNSIKNKLGQEEKERLDTHLATLEKIEQGLSADADNQNTGEVCGPVASSGGSEMLDDFFTIAEIVAAALKCGITNVASVMCGDGQGEYVVPNSIWPQLNMPVGQPNNFHSAGHSGVKGPDYGRMMAVFQQVPAYLLSLLASETAPGESEPLINSTMLCMVNGMGNGDHSPQGAPWLLGSGNTSWGLGSFAATNQGSALDVLASVPERMGLDGNLTGA